MRTRAGSGLKTRASGHNEPCSHADKITLEPHPPCAFTSITAAPDCDVDLPDDRVVGPLAIRPAAPLADPEAAVADALRQPHRHAAAGRGRPRPQERLHPHLRHHAAGAQPAASCRRSCAPSKSRASPAATSSSSIATGLHRPNEGAELVEMVGPEIAAQLPHREPPRQGPRRARLPRHHAQRRAGLARLAATSGPT